MTGILIKGERLEIETDVHMRRMTRKMTAEIGVMLLQAKKYPTIAGIPPEARKRKGSTQSLKGPQLC